MFMLMRKLSSGKLCLGMSQLETECPEDLVFLSELQQRFASSSECCKQIFIGL